MQSDRHHITEKEPMFGPTSSKKSEAHVRSFHMAVECFNNKQNVITNLFYYTITKHSGTNFSGTFFSFRRTKSTKTSYCFNWKTNISQSVSSERFIYFRIFSVWLKCRKEKIEAAFVDTVTPKINGSAHLKVIVPVLVKI